jgi:membrane associated rhomboid family serine protease
MEAAGAGTATQTCYRHPNRVTGVSCSSCGRPICPDCMTPTPVGMRCPECAKQRTKVHGVSTVRSEPRVTVAIIIVCVLAFLGSGSFGLGNAGGGRLVNDFALFGPAIDSGNEYWRLITGGFLHAGLLHVAFNMYLLWILGGALERFAGTLRFLAIYFVALLWGSAGALVLSPDSRTVGASGAVFGLMAALFLLERQKGIALLGGSVGALLVINLVFTFAFPGVSIGGHVGGILGGLAAGFVLSGFGRGHLAYGRVGVEGWAAIVGLLVGAVVVGVMVS